MSKHVSVSNPALKNALDCTTQLFADPANGIDDLSFEHRLVATLSYMAATAFAAGKTPEKVAGIPTGSTSSSVGVQEQTIDGTTVTHLHKEMLRGFLDSVLSIELKSLSNVIDKDSGIRVPFFQQPDVSDPFVVLTKGVSMSTTKAFEDSVRVDFGSERHYLFIRKKEKTMFKEAHDKLNIYVFDRDDSSVDQESSMNTIESKNWRYHSKCELLGSKSYDLKDLQKTGRHSLSVEFGKHKIKYPSMRLDLEYEFLSFDNYVRQKEQKGKVNWIDRDIFTQDADQMFNEVKSMNIGACERPLPLLYLYNKDTSTQAWIHICEDRKVVIVAFNGTGAEDNFRDLWTDLKCELSTLKGTDIDEYKFDSSESLEQKSGTVHTGFRDAYMSVRDNLLETLHNVTLWSEHWLIVFTGHSLGGALATLAAYEACNRTLNGKRPKVAMINYACPRLASAEFREAYDRSVEVSYRFRAPDDIVPCVPAGSRHVGREVEQGTNGRPFVKELNDDGQTFWEYAGEAAREALLDPSSIAKMIRDCIGCHDQDHYFDTISKAGAAIRRLDMRK